MTAPSLFSSAPAPDAGLALFVALRAAREGLPGEPEPMLCQAWDDMAREDRRLFALAADAACSAVPDGAGASACGAWARFAGRANPWDEMPKALRVCWEAGAKAARAVRGVQG